MPIRSPPARFGWLSCMLSAGCQARDARWMLLPRGEAGEDDVTSYVTSLLHLNKTMVSKQKGRYQHIEVWDVKPYAAGAVAVPQ